MSASKKKQQSQEIINLGKNLRAYRKKANLTTQQVGALIGKSHNSISAWERAENEPPLSDLFALREIYNIPSVVDLLVDIEDGDIDLVLSKSEKIIILAYRSKPEVQHAVRILLGVDEDNFDR